MSEDVKRPDNNSDNEGFLIGNDFVIEDNYELSKEDSENFIKKIKKEKASSIRRTIIWVVCLVVISVSLAIGIVYAAFDYLGIGFNKGKTVTLDIKNGTATVTIANKLKEQGAINSPLLFRVYSKLKKYDGKYKYGLYTFSDEAGYESIAQMLMTEGAKAKTIKVTIPEGSGINDFVKNVNGEKVTVIGIGTILQKAGVCTKSDFIEALGKVKLNSKLLQNVNQTSTYMPLEGYLFPETYEFYAYDSKESAKLVVERMIAQSEKRITDKMYKRAEELGYSMNEILTMASIIQMEAGKSFDQMPNVAGVFYNRLGNSKTAGTLGSSPTCFYGDSYSQDDGRYNTQADEKFSAIKGFPPGPLCSPGIDAINAALYPTENSPYYYFVTDSSGKFYFHKTIEEQNKTIAKLKKNKNWTYEYFN